MIFLRGGALCAAIFCASAPALAADWKLASLAMGSGNRGITYVDAASVQPKRGKIRFRSEQYLETPRQGYDRIAALSEVDCESMALTVLREGYYSGRAVVAFNSIPRTSSHYSSGTSEHWMLRRVCEGDYLSDSVQDQGSDSARMFALDWSPVPGRLSVVMPVSIGRPSGTQVASASGSSTAAQRR
jgi:hypothetical protein